MLLENIPIELSSDEAFLGVIVETGFCSSCSTLRFFFALSTDGWSALLLPKARFDSIVLGALLSRDCFSIDVASSSTPSKTERRRPPIEDVKVLSSMLLQPPGGCWANRRGSQIQQY